MAKRKFKMSTAPITSSSPSSPYQPLSNDHFTSSRLHTFACSLSFLSSSSSPFNYFKRSTTTTNCFLCHHWNCHQRWPWRRWRYSSIVWMHLLLQLLSLVLWATWSTSSAEAAVHHQQFRRTALYAWNNFTDLPTAAATANLEKGGSGSGGFESESSVVLPDSRSSTDCPPTTSSHCLRCTSDGCIKCPLYLVTDTRQCVDRCPSSYIDQWSANTEFMGRVCISTGYSGPMIAALAGLIGGFLVCLSLLAVAVMMIKRRRRRKMIKQKLINENTMDPADFMRQLNEMRPNAEYFLAMLNDTRRQIRKLYLSGEVAAANSYRPLVRDLAKILILLNRPIELIPTVPPHDWNRLHAWSDQALERYKPQVGQLIDFFQTSSNFDDGSQFDAHFEKSGSCVFSGGGGRSGAGGFIYKQASDADMGSMQHSANDLSSIGAQTTAQKLHLFGSLISLHEFEEPRPSDPFGSSFNTLKGNLISDLNASSLWLEDEFYKLGFRPQDVITTEL